MLIFDHYEEDNKSDNVSEFLNFLIFLIKKNKIISIIEIREKFNDTKYVLKACIELTSLEIEITRHIIIHLC